MTANILKYTAQVRTFDIGKAKERLGYRPEVGMEEEIKRAMRWNLEREAGRKKESRWSCFVFSVEMRKNYGMLF